MNHHPAWALALVSLCSLSGAAAAPTRCEVGGSAAGAYARLEDALQAGCRELQLAPGRHLGGVTLPEGARVRGRAGAVVVGPDTGAAFHAPQGATFDTVTIEGGEEGVSGARLVMRGVRLLRQRKSGVRADGALTLTSGTFELVANARGVIIAEGATASIERVELDGPAQRGIESRASSLRLRHVRIRGALTAVHQHGGRVDVEDLEASGGTEAAGLALVRASGRLRRIRLQGFEHAVLTQHCAQLTLEEVVSRRAGKAGLGLVSSEVRVRDVQISQSGAFGAIQVLGGKAQIEDFWFHQASELGLLARSAEVTLRRGRITGVSSFDGSEGSAIFLISGQLTARELLIQEPAGYAVMAITNARANFDDLTVQAPGAGALAADTHAELSVRRLVVHRSGGTLLVADGDGRIDVASLRQVSSTQKLAESPCRGRTRITVRRASAPGASPAAPGACLQLP